MATPAMMEEWQKLRHDYARAFGSPDEYEDVYFLAMGRYSEHMGRRESGSWFTHPEEAGADGEAIRDWWREMVRQLKPTVEQRDHFLIYASDLLFMEGDLAKSWREFLAVPREYVLEAFDGVPVGSGTERMKTVKTAWEGGLPASFIRDAPGGLRDNVYIPENLYDFFYLWKNGVTPDFARAVRKHRNGRDPFFVSRAAQSGVPAEYIASLPTLPMTAIVHAWEQQLPPEYAQELYSAYTPAEE